MPKFSIRIPHNLSVEEAKQRLNGFVDVIREKFQNKVSDLEQSWEGDTLHFRFKTYGIPLSGAVAVAAKELVVEVELPFTAMMFKGQIQSSIQEHLARLVSPEGA
jgi:putative polyhydroxyalkanoate system protein